MVPIACRCSCGSVVDEGVHAVVDALAEGDIDRALDAGLLTVEPCEGCSPACLAMLLDSRGTRVRAWAARERFRARAARLTRHQQELDERRIAVANAPVSLPPAAAAALARAKAKAAGHE